MTQSAESKQHDRLEQVLDRVSQSEAHSHQVSVDAVLDQLGRRSFGPILLFSGLIMVAPIIGDIPGVPVILGLLIALTAGQLLLHHEHIWLPQWLLKRSVSRDKLDKVLGWLRPVARFLDRWSRPRLTALTEQNGTYAVAVACILIGLATPVMEVVPFSANFAGIAVTAFGLSLVVRDGLVTLLALGFTLGTLALLIYHVAA